MRDLSFMHDAEPKSGTSGLDSHDPRLLSLVDLAKKGSYEDAAQMVRTLYDEGIRDVRLVAYPLYQAFREDGVSCLGEVMNLLGELQTNGFPGYGPSERRDLHLVKTLTWMFQEIRDAIVYHQKKKDESWTAWMALEDVTLADAIERGQSLAALLASPTFKGPGELVAHVTRTIAEIRDAKSAREEAAKKVEEAEVVSAPAPRTEVPRANAIVESASGLAHLGQMITLRGSPMFVELLNKLRAFELLIQKRDYEKAALVSDDILHLLESFDPRKYFPELFAPFGALLNQNVQAIKPYWENKDSVDWKMLEQFYQVDLETFIGGGGGGR